MSLEVPRKSSSPVSPVSPPVMDSSARMGCRSRLRRGDDKSFKASTESEEEYVALCLVMLAHGVRDEVKGGGGVVGVGTASIKVSSQQQGYECSVCGKVYGCYKAFGGHKTKHRKLPTQKAAAAADWGTTSGCRSAEGKVHRCLLCLRTFPSGQALGGHKHLHYEGGGTTKGIDSKDNREAVKAKDAAMTASLNSFDMNLPATAPTIGNGTEIVPLEAKRARTMLPAV